ncbi:hypothetical protein VTK73DRAFT_394 [Phialemonium thermophilum]|uniref:Hikeshi-like domain-containing protein n=1 Tax=Phialemonium thermophilum TaxID=223376 RepID=A0ABR3XEI5_9PEZI
MSRPLFGLVPAGQPVITVPTETPLPTSFLYAIPVNKPFSHVVVFLLPDVVLPPDTAAAIYLVTPAPPGQTTPVSRFLGGIGPGKESAIFNVGQGSTPSPPATPIVIGVSIEPAGSVAQRIAERPQNQHKPQQQGAEGGSAQPSTLVLAQRIIKNAFNFLSSFSGTAGQVEVVPLKAFEEWWRKFESRIRADPGFLERDE